VVMMMVDPQSLSSQRPPDTRLCTCARHRPGEFGIDFRAKLQYSIKGEGSP